MVEELEICVFLQTGSSCVHAVFQCWRKTWQPPSQDGGKGAGGGAEKSHKNYLRAGKNACERQGKLILQTEQLERGVGEQEELEPGGRGAVVSLPLESTPWRSSQPGLGQAQP